MNSSERTSPECSVPSSGALSRASSQTSLQSSVEGSKDHFTSPRFDSSLLRLSRAHGVKRICFVGAGYVGGPTAAVIAYCNPDITVTVVDKSETRINRWQCKHLPIHEPGLTDIVRIARDGANGVDLHDGHPLKGERALPARQPNLFFSTDCDRHIAEADVVFLSVNTPTKTTGIGGGAATDISMFESAARSVALVAKPGAIIVEKSTVPCRTAQAVRDIFNFHRPGVPFEILSNPEFLAEGTAINDLLHPSRILIGSLQTLTGLEAAEKLADVYAGWVPRASILTVGLWSSELSKLVANAMLAQRISSINSISAICEKTGANIHEVSKAIGMDPRLGAKFLQAGLGFGGSCFKKDILSLSYLAESLDLPEVAQYWRSVVQMNQWQCSRFVRSLVTTLNGSLRGKKIAILGYAFKKDTSDTRESQAIEVIRQLLPECPASITIFDPQCNKQEVENEMGALDNSAHAAVLGPAGPVSVCDTAYEACANATAVLILTEWTQFSYPPTSAAKPTTLESNACSTRHIRPTYKHRQISKMDLLERRAAVQDDLATLQNTPHVRLDPSNDTFGRFRPEPACPEGCTDCVTAHDAASRHSSENVDWSRIAAAMLAPRWVFDGRGMVDQQGMELLGFQVKSIGRGRAD